MTIMSVTEDLGRQEISLFVIVTFCLGKRLLSKGPQKSDQSEYLVPITHETEKNVLTRLVEIDTY